MTSHLMIRIRKQRTTLSTTLHTQAHTHTSMLRRLLITPASTTVLLPKRSLSALALLPPPLPLPLKLGSTRMRESCDDRRSLLRRVTISNSPLDGTGLDFTVAILQFGHPFRSGAAAARR